MTAVWESAPITDDADELSVYRRHLNDNRHLRLGFEPALENAYRGHMLEVAGRGRVVLSAALLALYLVTPWLDALLLHPPDAFVPSVRAFQFGIVTPLLIAAIATSVIDRLRRHSHAVTLAALAAITLCSLYQRWLGHQLNYETAISWATITMLGAFFFLGFRLRQVLPLALVMLGAILWTELRVGLTGAGPVSVINTTYEIQVNAMMFALGALGNYLLEVNTRLNWLEARDLQLRLLYDNLTGVWTRNYFKLSYRRLFELSRRERRSLAVAMVDIDHFKAFNDHHGHIAGDQCLARIGAALNTLCKNHSAYCARVGGEEFAVVLYGEDRQAAAAFFERLCTDIAALAIPHGNAPAGIVTVSVGGCWLQPDAASNRFDVLRRADNALYRAKSEGRNRMIMAEASG